MNAIRAFGTRAATTLALLAGLVAAPAQALELEFFDGEMFMTVSHNLNYGVNVSVEKASERVIYGGNPDYCQTGQRGECTSGTVGTNPTNYQRFYSHGGKNSGPNDALGHTAFNRGVTANQFKGTTDINVSWGEFSAFTRLLYFYDYEIMNRPRNNHPVTGEDVTFTSSARDEIGTDFRTLGAYVAWDTFIADMPITVRVGEQVINWGQSTFLPGIGLTNPIDLNRLSAPGFQLRELFKPVDMLFASVGLTENVAVEAYYQYGWEPLVLPPGGSFWAFNNYTGEGVNDAGQGVVCLDGSPFAGTLKEGFNSDGSTTAAPASGQFTNSYCIPASPTGFADDGNEWGVRLQVTLPWLNYTQFSLYAIRYNSRLPAVGGIRAGIVPSAGRAICDGLEDTFGGGGSCTLTTRAQDFPLAQVHYVEDLYAYGFSWSSNLPGGWSFAGEVSLKKDFPVQVSLPELIGSVAGLQGVYTLAGGAVIPGIGPLSGVLPGASISFRCSLRELDQTGDCDDQVGSDPAFSGGTTVPLSTITNLGPGLLGLPSGLNCDPAKGESCDSVGAYNIGSNVVGEGRGFQPLDVWQAQFTLIKLFPQALWSDNLTFVFEGIYARVQSMPDSIQFEIPDFTDFSNASRADDHGWGWRALFKLDYTSLFGSSWNVSPLLVLFHDVDGSLPANTATFYEGRRQAILAFLFDYQNQYQISFKYAYFGGFRSGNIYQDRDSFSVNFATSF